MGAVIGAKMVKMAQYGRRTRFAEQLRTRGRAEMNELKSLEDRLKSAVARIETAASTGNDTYGLAAENAQLKADLATLKEQRRADMAELDRLMEKLRPMLEEADA